METVSSPVRSLDPASFNTEVPVEWPPGTLRGRGRELGGLLSAEGHVRALSYLVMRGHVESHEPLEENFRGLVVAKEGVSVNIVAGLELSNGNKPQETQKEIHQKKMHISPSLGHSPVS